MPRIVPAYRQRKGYDQAIVTLRDAVTRRARDYWLGPYNTPQSRELYHRLIADWEANGRRLIQPPQVESATPQGITVVELCRQYWDWAVGQFGQQDASNLKLMLRVLVRLCGSTPAHTFGPNKLRQVREAMIHGDPDAKSPRRPWSRKYVNVQVQRIIRIFKWAAARELLPVTIYQQLRTIEPLRRGRCAARETEPVKPVADKLVDAIQPYVSKQVWALIELQRLTGARPCELFQLRPIDLHTTDASGVWTYSPDEHKTAHRGRTRTIYIGPKAQDVIRPFLADRTTDAPLFSPAEAEAERRIAMHAKRTTPLSCGNKPGSNRQAAPRKMPGTQYTTASYSKAILFGCEKAFPLPTGLARGRVPDPKSVTRKETQHEWRKRLGEQRWAQVIAWRKAHHWHPYQLRHSAATNIRRQFGLEAAQIALGHSSALVTEAVYAERDMQKAVDVMLRIG